jgi:precorrin-6Y C5,15-methyltransferase (decarboxylating)
MQRVIDNNIETAYSCVIFGGTTEGRLLAEHFASGSVTVHISVATEYGAELIPDADNIHIHHGRMDEGEMERFFLDINPDVCVDATHPYAVEVTKNIKAACENTGIRYMRVQRQNTAGDISYTGCEGKNYIKYVATVEEAAEFLSGTKGNIFITTGSKELAKYTVIPDYRERCFARVLPTVSVLENCRELGFEGRNLIAMQGPFSMELNSAMLRQYNASVLVTKQSGTQGGYQEKCEAALQNGVNLVIVGAPDEDEKGYTLDDAIKILDKESNTFGISDKKFLKKIYLIGMGPGNPAFCTGKAKECLDSANVIIGAKRILNICDSLNGDIKEKPHFTEYKPDKVTEFINTHTEYREIAIVFSGDIGYYSGAEKMAEYLKKAEPDADIERIPGISSPLYFLDRIGAGWADVKLLSRHGQDCNVVKMLKEYGKACVLLGKAEDVSDICSELIKAGYKGAWVCVGERLSYLEERIVSGSPDEFIGMEFDALSVLYVAEVM